MNRKFLVPAFCMMAAMGGLDTARADDAPAPTAPSPVELETARADMQAAIARYNHLRYARLEWAAKEAIKGKDAWWADCLAKPACIEWLHPKPATAASQ